MCSCHSHYPDWIESLDCDLDYDDVEAVLASGIDTIRDVLDPTGLCTDASAHLMPHGRVEQAAHTFTVASDDDAAVAAEACRFAGESVPTGSASRALLRRLRIGNCSHDVTGRRVRPNPASERGVVGGHGCETSCKSQVLHDRHVTRPTCTTWNRQTALGRLRPPVRVALHRPPGRSCRQAAMLAWSNLCLLAVHSRARVTSGTTPEVLDALPPT
jgi:hypothetical protein